MNKDKLQGKTREIEGQVLRRIGQVTGSRKTQAKGLLRQAEGKLQGAVGRVKDAAKGAKRRPRVKVPSGPGARSTR